MKWIIAAFAIWLAWKYLRPTRRITRPGTPDTDRSEARRILGVGRDADSAAVRAAHRRLVAGVHPDRGGSAELARRVNWARDVLLAKGDVARD